MTALCSYCKKDMSDGATISCTGNKTIDGRYFKDNQSRQAIPHDGNGRCGDCNVAPGGYHHLNCDMERCPKCKGQLISCGCLAAPPPPNLEHEASIEVIRRLERLESWASRQDIYF